MAYLYRGGFVFNFIKAYIPMIYKEKKVLSKTFSISFSLILGILVFFSFLSQIYAVQIDDVYSCSNVISGVYNLGKQLGYNIDKDRLIDDLNYYGSSPFISKRIKPDVLIKAVRNQGLFLNGFRIDEDDISYLSNLNNPFLVYLKDIGYSVVKEVGKQSNNLRFNCILPDKNFRDFSQEEFLSLWNKNIFSLPLVGIMAKRLNSGNVDSKARFISIYSYHSGEEDFKSFKKIVDRLRKEAKKEAKKLIYLDELGLIPYKSVKKKMRREDISEEDVFLKIRDSISNENKLLEDGFSVNLPNPFYDDFFSYLAKHKIKSVIEELDYELWRDIIRFDNLKLYDKAVSLFLSRNVSGYIDFISKHTYGFWKYNVQIRDLSYKKQIEDIMKKYPDSIIFSLRGLGHYGMEEKIDIDDFSVETYVFLNNKNFSDNLISSQKLYVLWSNGVKIDNYSKKIMFLRSFFQELLRDYLKEQTGKSIIKSTCVAVNKTKTLTFNDILKLTADIRKSVLLFRIRNKKQLQEFVYTWLTENKLNNVEI